MDGGTFFESIQRIVDKNIPFTLYTVTLVFVVTALTLKSEDWGRYLRSLYHFFLAKLVRLGTNGWSSEHSADVQYRPAQNPKGKQTMDVIQSLSVLGSVASIISFFEPKAKPTVEKIVAHYRKRQKQNVGAERVIGPSITDDDIAATAAILLKLNSNAPKYLNRIANRCVKPYQDAIDDH